MNNLNVKLGLLGYTQESSEREKQKQEKEFFIKSEEAESQ